MSLGVQPRFGPTLAQFWRSSTHHARWLIIAVAAIAVAAIAVVGGEAVRRDGTAIVVREPVALNLVHGSRLRRVPAAEALLRLETTSGVQTGQSFEVRSLQLAPYRGTPAGALPRSGSARRAALEARLPGFELVREGRTRVNENPGYELLYRARPNGRLIFGRFIELLPALDVNADFVFDTVRDGVTLDLRAPFVKDVLTNAEDVGNVGALKQPFRSFRFGTERTGGAGARKAG